MHLLLQQPTGAVRRIARPWEGGSDRRAGSTQRPFQVLNTTTPQRTTAVKLPSSKWQEAVWMARLPDVEWLRDGSHASVGSG